MEPATINAIAGLWKLLAVLVLTMALVSFRNEIKAILKVIIERGFKFEGFGTKAEVPPGQAKLPDVLPLAIESPKQTEAPNVVDAELVKQEVKALEEVRTVAAEEQSSTAEQWLGKLYAALELKDSSAAESAFAEASKLLTPGQLIYETAFYYYSRYRNLADTSALKKLLDFAQGSGDPRGDVHLWMGYCYSLSGFNEKAIAAFRFSMSQAKAPADMLRALSPYTKTLYRAGRIEEARGEIERVLSNTGSEDVRSRVFEIAADMFQEAEEYQLQALCLEKALETRPNDTGLTFAIAYAYSRVKPELQDLSFLHYLRHLSFSPQDAMALNNLGVAYEALDLPMRAVKSYTASADLKNTLAMANLANLKLNAGFAAEARELLVKAQGEQSVHENVSHWLTELNKRAEQEEERRTKVIRKAEKREQFLREYTEALFRVVELWLPKQWTIDAVQVALDLQDSSLKAVWTVGSLKYSLSATLHNAAGSFKIVAVYAEESQVYKSLLIQPSLPNDVEGNLYIDGSGRIQIFQVGDEADTYRTMQPKTEPLALSAGAAE